MMVAMIIMLMASPLMLIKHHPVPLIMMPMISARPSALPLWAGVGAVPGRTVRCGIAIKPAVMRPVVRIAGVAPASRALKRAHEVGHWGARRLLRLRERREQVRRWRFGIPALQNGGERWQPVIAAAIPDALVGPL
jgi:hypothetical protein